MAIHSGRPLGFIFGNPILEVLTCICTVPSIVGEHLAADKLAKYRCAAGLSSALPTAPLQARVNRSVTPPLLPRRAANYEHKIGRITADEVSAAVQPLPLDEELLVRPKKRAKK